MVNCIEQIPHPENETSELIFHLRGTEGDFVYADHLADTAGRLATELLIRRYLQLTGQQDALLALKADPKQAADDLNAFLHAQTDADSLKREFQEKRGELAEEIIRAGESTYAVMLTVPRGDSLHETADLDALRSGQQTKPDAEEKASAAENSIGNLNIAGTGATVNINFGGTQNNGVPTPDPAPEPEPLRKRLRKLLPFLVLAAVLIVGLCFLLPKLSPPTSGEVVEPPAQTTETRTTDSTAPAETETVTTETEPAFQPADTSVSYIPESTAASADAVSTTAAVTQAATTAAPIRITVQHVDVPVTPVAPVTPVTTVTTAATTTTTTTTTTTNQFQYRPVSYTLTFKDGTGAVALNGVEITGVNSDPDQNLVIPEQIDGSPVVGIGANAFQSVRYAFTSVYMPSVQYIGEHAFEERYAGADLDLRNVRYIGSYAFQNCSGLSNITLGAELTAIGERAFFDHAHTTRTFDYPNSMFVWDVFVQEGGYALGADETYTLNAAPVYF